MAKNKIPKQKISKSPVIPSPIEWLIMTEKMIQTHAKSKGTPLSEPEITWLLEFYQAPEVAAMLTEVQDMQEKIHQTRIRKISVTFGTALALFIFVFFSVEVLEPKSLALYGLFCLAFGSLIGTLIAATSPNYTKLIAEQCSKARIFFRLSKLLSTGEDNTKKPQWISDSLDILVQNQFLKPSDTFEQEFAFATHDQSDGTDVAIVGYQFTSSTRWTHEKGHQIDMIADHCYLLRATFDTDVPFAKSHLHIQQNTARLSKSTRPAHFSTVLVFALSFLLLLIVYPKLGNSGTITLLAGGVMIALIFAGIQKFQISQNSDLQKTQSFEKLFETRNANHIKAPHLFPMRFKESLLKITKKQGNVFEFYFDDHQVYLKRNLGHYEFLSLDTKALLPENQTVFIDWYIEMKEITALLVELPVLLGNSDVSQPTASTNGFATIKLPTASVS